ncbi:unnamed protein product [Brachionus calyciflorus]|uniref:Uncharacterized protein n=1 Tax=Brachionus calyciflorus TaxID=104777 RepID=A0A814C5W1_9BILA|nr:unnamed protein product [Brachionus calyciflorus]
MAPNIEIVYENILGSEDIQKQLNIVHFNDVYNVESSKLDPVGGAARFLTALENVMQKGPTLVLFSGDAISPSAISILVKGRQMIEILNKFHISCACLGNHDFDFGLDVLLTHINNSNFPWLISNVFDAESRKPLGNVSDRHIVEINGLKVGIIGLVEQEWITTLSTINSDDIFYESYVDCGRRLTRELKNEQNCDIVIALTHMRWANDSILAQNLPEVDIFLGGHDHDYIVQQINNKWVVKSGTDFREFSLIELNVKEKSSTVQKIEKYVIDSKIEENIEIKTIVDSYLENINKELEQILGYMNTELEGRFSYIRTQETNLGNFITDIMLSALNADCAILNSGTLRSDLLHPTGEFKVRDLKKILPYLDENVVISVTGAHLLQALENGVSQYPKHEGRFLQVSGLKFAFDPSKPPGKRVDPRLVQVQDEYLDLEKNYSLATKLYLKQGKDGFDCLLNCPVLVEEENIPVLYNLVENHFKTIGILKRNTSFHKFRSSIVPLVIVNRLMHKISQDPSVQLEDSQSPSDTPRINFYNAALIVTKVLSHRQKILSRKQRSQIKQTEKYKKKMAEYEERSMKLAPKVEGRIICIKDQEHYEQLLMEIERNKIC